MKLHFGVGSVVSAWAFSEKHFCGTKKFMEIYDYRSGIWPQKEILEASACLQWQQTKRPAVTSV